MCSINMLDRLTTSAIIVRKRDNNEKKLLLRVTVMALAIVTMLPMMASAERICFGFYCGDTII